MNNISGSELGQEVIWGKMLKTFFDKKSNHYLSLFLLTNNQVVLKSLSEISDSDFCDIEDFEKRRGAIQ